MLINLDLKQIEVVVAAQLSKDPTLIHLLNNGLDMHRYVAADVYNKSETDVTDEERQAAKAIDFQLFYGAGANKISLTTGHSFEWCKEFIEKFYIMFPKIKDWHDSMILRVNMSGNLELWDGMILKFKQYEAKFDWQDPTKLYYNPAEIKNYPVQHSAFVIISAFIAEFMRLKALHNRDKYLLINTVHDSVMLDCRPEHIEQAQNDLKEVLDKLPETLYNKFGLKLLVPITADISTGLTWYDL